jgi:hypothetical protein
MTSRDVQAARRVLNAKHLTEEQRRALAVVLLALGSQPLEEPLGTVYDVAVQYLTQQDEARTGHLRALCDGRGCDEPRGPVR